MAGDHPGLVLEAALKEVYQVLSGMLGQEQRIAQIANNLANINTVGFKKDGASFEDHLKMATGTTAVSANSAAPRGIAEVERIASWPELSARYTDFSAGPLQVTGRALDVAIGGEGFFQVQPQGAVETFYTRAGNFTLGPDGSLVTPDGHAVLDENGRGITLNTQLGTAQVTSDGMVRQGGADVARLGISRFQDPQRLVKLGDGLLYAPAGVDAEAVEVPSVKPGTLEGSNVNAIREMVDMIELQRAYDANQKAMLSIDDVTKKRIDAAMS